MFQKILCLSLLLFLLSCAKCSAYEDDDALSSGDSYNGTDAYLSLYEYDTSYVANLPDPYDFSKSWSIESEEPCEGPHCDAHAPQLDPAGAPFAAASSTDFDPLYVYDNCIATADGTGYIINGTRDCGLELRGADAAVDLLQGGVDGSYQVTGCYEGKPMYTRMSAAGHRTLFYNPYMGDWEISIGTEPNEDQLVMYGDLGCVSPLDVPRWHLSASLSSAESQHLPEDEDLYFIHPYVTVACAGEPHVNKHPRHAGGGGQDYQPLGQQRRMGGRGYAGEHAAMAGGYSADAGYDHGRAARHSEHGAAGGYEYDQAARASEYADGGRYGYDTAVPDQDRDYDGDDAEHERA